MNAPMTAERYWEGRWRDEKAENDRLRADNVMMANALAKKIGTEHLDEIARLRAAVERMGIGCNHIATYRTDHWPDYGSHPQVALETLGAGREYDMWCCWNAHMCARDSLALQTRCERIGSRR